MRRSLVDLQREVEHALKARSREVEEAWSMPVRVMDGKLLRPLVAAACQPPGGLESSREDALWWGALAIQMVHEASLLHDDIVDDASMRRGAPTMVAQKGATVALIQGDHLLTGAYRVALKVGEPRFLEWFIQAVERTVAGEKGQGAVQGQHLDMERYREIVTRKSGDLFGAAVVLPVVLAGGSSQAVERAFLLGGHLGCLYQMVDDFLDFCPGAALGKPPLQDYYQEKWTWPLGVAGVTDFGLERGSLLKRLFHASPGVEPAMSRALGVLEGEAEALREELGEEYLPGLGEIMDRWLGRAREALSNELRPLNAPAAPNLSAAWTEEAHVHVAAAAQALGGHGGWERYFAQHARSFRFAARLFPTQSRREVAGVYAFCRFTDDLVDDPKAGKPEERSLRLQEWRRLAERAYQGEQVGIPLLDEVMGFTAARAVPFTYVDELLAGVEMDLHPRFYPDTEALKGYSYRVASVVGLWLTELFGVRDPWVLARAETMGHAMQLTNILRDVGEDARAGRLYLPLDALERFGVSWEEIQEWARKGGEPSAAGWLPLMESLLTQADGWYAEAFRAIPFLPPFFQRPVAVASRVYQGIHGEIRGAGYDVFHRRNSTSLPRKVILGTKGLLELRRSRRAVMSASAPASALFPSHRATTSLNLDG
ncbi:MAG: squalene/phytoene synthase family protein [Gemmatimonadota bacterium]